MTKQSVEDRLKSKCSGQAPTSHHIYIVPSRKWLLDTVTVRYILLRILWDEWALNSYPFTHHRFRYPPSLSIKQTLLKVFSIPLYPIGKLNSTQGQPNPIQKWHRKRSESYTKHMSNSPLLQKKKAHERKTGNPPLKKAGPLPCSLIHMWKGD